MINEAITAKKKIDANMLASKAVIIYKKLDTNKAPKKINISKVASDLY